MITLVIPCVRDFFPLAWTRSFSRVAFAAFVALPAVGCEAPEHGDMPAVDAAVDAGAVRQAVMDRDERGLSLLTADGARASMAEPGSFVHVFASARFATDYARIQPTASGSAVDLPRGDMVVREIYDAGGELEKITVIVRGPVDSNPAVGDLWFGVATPAGDWQLDDRGAPRYGALANCGGCHASRAGDGWLFGMPQ